MSYIGKIPTVGNFQVCDAISVVNNQAAYTMQVGSVNVSPESANHMIVSLNGVIQKPTDAYTVSNSVITFASNLVTNDVINFIQILGNVLDLGVPSDSTVSIAKLTATGTKNSTTFLRGDNTFNAPPNTGITVADMFRLTADINATNADITSNLERCDDASYAKIGTGMSVSSGIFTFPSTGLYQVIVTGNFQINSADLVAELIGKVTTNNSSYDDVVQVVSGYEGSNTKFETNTNSCFVNVTNTSNVKIKFATESFAGGTLLKGNTDYNKTNFTFIRLGDSQ